jgi:hypothetical protein
MNVMEYFRVRKAWDAKERVASAEVVLLKEAQARYAGRKLEELYEKWRQGAIADAEVMQSGEQACPSLKRVFRAIVSGSSLRVFTDPRGNDAENWTEYGSVSGSSQISANPSPVISGT